MFFAPRLLSLLALLLLPLPVQAGPKLDAIRAGGIIRIGLTGDYKPFSSFDPQTKTFTGLDVDLGRSLARGLGVKAEFIKTSWPMLMADLEAGKFDIAMGGVSVTPERAKLGLFSTPLLSDGKTPIVRCAEAMKFQTLPQIDQASVRVIVNPGGTNERFARINIRHAQIIMHKDNTTIFGEIANEHADVMITDAIEAKLQQRLNPRLCAVHPDAPFERVEKAYLMPRDAELKLQVDNWLEGIRRTGALSHEITQWIE